MPSLSRIDYFGLNTEGGPAWEGRGKRGKPEAPWTMTAPIILGIWFGLVTGLLELGLLYARSQLLGWSTLSALQISRHFAWMIPMANLVLFLGWGLIVGLLGRVWPLFGTRRIVLLLSFPAFLALLLLLPGLYRFACIALAAGFSSVAARWVPASSGKVRRLVCTSLPVLLVVSAMLSGWKGSQLVLGEQWASAALPAPRAGAMNVLLVVMDTVRADRLSLHGYGRKTTANLERLAPRAIRFDQARSTAPWTLPSHASMFTGLWPHQTAVGEDRPLDTTYPTLAEFLSARGYLTAGFVGNTYFCNSWYGLGRGFAHYEDFYDEDLVVSVTETLRSSALGRCLVHLVNLPLGAERRRKDAADINEDFLDWLSEQEKERPFFAFINFFDAHSPYLLPEDCGHSFGHVETAAELAVLQNWETRPKQNIPENERTLVSDAYDDCLTYLDSQIGKLIDELERRGVLDNTLVIITADHGEELGEHRLYGHGQSLYSQELHVPLMILLPGNRAAGRIVADPVSLRDIPATIVELLGASGDSPFPGNSLARCWEPGRGKHDQSATAVLSEVALREKVSKNQNRAPAWRGPMASVVALGKSYIRNADGREELYDIRSDPADSRDLVGSTDSTDSLAQLRDTLQALLAKEKRRN
jgi:arylsulfatase A-like enzyme